MDPIKRAVHGIIRQLLDRGWELPIYVATIGSNGGASVGVYEGPSETGIGGFRYLAEHVKSEGLRYPINTMWVNEKGEGVRVVLVQGEKEPKFLM